MDTSRDPLACSDDPRRDAVRRAGRNGIDYVEAGDDHAPELRVYFLGKLPPQLAAGGPAIGRHLRLEGGDRITGLRILAADPQPQADPARDDFLVLTLDRIGDFSTYRLRLVGVQGIDPRYDSASVRFRVCCPSDLDCRPDCDCAPATPEEPPINYLARDYASFRQLMLDRLAVLMPSWSERHVPDLGITLVELLAYTADQLSYYQDAVGTEAYLGTARQRISVRRHARLVDGVLHEGCNARTWIHFHVSGRLELPSDAIAFATGYNQPATATRTVISAEDLDKLPPSSYEFYEPLLAAPRTLLLLEAHNAIPVYTWGRRECCLPAGATRATLLDRWVEPAGPGGEATRALQIAVGDVLVFEEVIGPKTGVAADSDPLKRWAVRVTRVVPAEDSLYTVAAGEQAPGRPTPLLEIEWAQADALPFALCLGALGPAPDCAWIGDITVVRANVILVDHGRTLVGEELPRVPVVVDAACCECEGQPGDVQVRPGRYRPQLARSPLVHRQALPARALPASRTLAQDERAAVPSVVLHDADGAVWTARADLLASGPDDRAFVAEIDNDGVANLRFGDGELGRQPAAGTTFSADYRVGGGSAGNVGAEAICLLVLRGFKEDPVDVHVRNPLAASGGVDPQAIDDARMLLPGQFRRQIERAITAADYAELAARNTALQAATAKLAWTGSWYEADVAVDPLGTEAASGTLLAALCGDLHRYRRMGHDLRVQAARYVPLMLRLAVCALPGHDRGHVKAALLARIGSRASGRMRGLFHPDELAPGRSIALSRIIAAAQSVAGVECVDVVAFHRLFEPPSHEIANGVLPLAANEIAQLDNDPDHPERGQLLIDVRGGRQEARMPFPSIPGGRP